MKINTRIVVTFTHITHHTQTALSTSDRGDAPLPSSMSDIGMHPNPMSPGSILPTQISEEKPEVCSYDVVREESGFYVQFPYAGGITEANNFKLDRMANGSSLCLVFNLRVSAASNLTVIGEQSPAIFRKEYVKLPNETDIPALRTSLANDSLERGTSSKLPRRLFVRMFLWIILLVTMCLWIILLVTIICLCMKMNT